MKTAVAIILALLLICSGAFIYHNNISVDDLTGKAISFSRFGSLIDRIRAPVRGAEFAADANRTYPIHLSLEDSRNPAFSSVDLGKYQAFQTANPKVFEQMMWTNSRNPTGKSIIYSSQNMGRLTYYIALLESNQPFPYTSPPAGTIRRVSGEDKNYFTEEEALNMWLPHIAVSLYVEVNHLVNWSVKSYNDEELAVLFDGRKFLTYNYAGVEGYTISFHYLNPAGIDGITDWNPFYTLEFLKSKKIITIPRTLPSPEPLRPIIGARETVSSFAKPEKEAQKKAIYALTQWMRANLVHQTSTSAEEYAEIYEYEGPFPLDKVLNPPTGAKSFTIGCSGTSSMYNAILGVINIPVTKSRSMDRHTAPLFTTVGLALIHGDDPYMLYYRRGRQEVPAKDMFMTIDEFHTMNSAPLEVYEGHTPDRMEQVQYLEDIRAAKQAYNSRAYVILRERAVDVMARIPSGSLENTLEHGWATMYWKPLFNSTEMNAMFSAMDTEILRIGRGNYTEGYLRICRGMIIPVPFDCNYIPRP